MDFIRPAREWASAYRTTAPAWLLLSAPSALWSYAVVSWIGWVWRDRRSAERNCWIACGAALGPLSEIGQGLRWVPGTFDVVDLALYLAAILLAVFRISYREANYVA